MLPCFWKTSPLLTWRVAAGRRDFPGTPPLVANFSEPELRRVERLSRHTPDGVGPAFLPEQALCVLAVARTAAFLEGAFFPTNEPHADRNRTQMANARITPFFMVVSLSCWCRVCSSRQGEVSLPRVYAAASGKTSIQGRIVSGDDTGERQEDASSLELV